MISCSNAALARGGLRTSPDGLDAFLYRSKLVWQGRYRFTVQPHAALEPGVYTETTFYLEGMELSTAPSARYVLLHYQGARILAALPYGKALDGTPLKGVFTPMDADLLVAMQQAMGVNTEVDRLFPYLFDTTRSFLAQRLSGLLWALLAGGGFAALAVRLARMLRHRARRPVYRKLAMLGGNEAALDALLATATPRKGVWLVPGWALRTGPLTTGLTRDFTLGEGPRME